MKNVVILGSTGSIGRSTLEVISRHRDNFRVVGLTANRNLALLRQQIEEFSPVVVATADEQAASKLSGSVGIPVFGGQEGLCRVASHEKADFVVSAIVGAAGLVPTMSAIRAGRTIGLANKETLVVAGDIVIQEAKRHGARILPVDSEHSAVFQCIDGRGTDSIGRIILTASGGPFVGHTRDQLERVTPQDALRHPSWDMGRKITIDSATLMNKGLEVIEAHYLFDLPAERIDVVIHPQSIVHSVVEFVDGCSLAQMSLPDMKAAIAYALSYPERLDEVIPRLDLSAIGELTFRRPDVESFPCLSHAFYALNEGGTMPAVLNAANEVAVAAFLESRIGFNDIPALIMRTMQSHKAVKAGSIEAVLEAHCWAINFTQEMVKTALTG